MDIAEILDRFDESLRKVKETDGGAGRINSPGSVHLAQSIVALKDWAAELPDDLAPDYSEER